MPNISRMEKCGEREQYEAHGYEDAWDLLADYFETLPTFEVFDYGYRQSMAGSPEEYAMERISALKGA